MTHDECLCKDLFRLYQPPDITKQDIKEMHIAIVVQLCQSYKESTSGIVDEKLYDASAEIVGEEDALVYIQAIGDRKSYAKTNSFVTETTFKTRKRQVIDNMLRKLYLTGG